MKKLLFASLKNPSRKKFFYKKVRVFLGQNCCFRRAHHLPTLARSGTPSPPSPRRSCARGRSWRPGSRSRRRGARRGRRGSTERGGDCCLDSKKTGTRMSAEERSSRGGIGARRRTLLYYTVSFFFSCVCKLWWLFLSSHLVFDYISFSGRACVSNVDRGSFFPFSIHKCDNLLQPEKRMQQQQQQNIFKSLSSIAKSRFKITDFST